MGPPRPDETGKMDPFKIQVEPFKENQDVKRFTCGNRDLDEFLTTDEVKRYESQGLGRTYLVYLKSELVAYFTVCNDSLRVEYLRRTRSFSRSAELMVDSYPAVKIGRLATAKGWQGRGIGKAVVAYIAKSAIESGSRFGVRLLIVEAKPESIPFYERCGFELTFETARERRRKNRTMFLDLQDLRSLLPGE
jgi:GNAT superfamily N-acetyltransferase